MCQASDARLAAGDLPRDEVEEGHRDFIAQCAPYQALSWQGEWMRVEHAFGQHGDVARACDALRALAERWARSDPRVHLVYARFLHERAGASEDAYHAAWRGVGVARDHLLDPDRRQGRDDDATRGLARTLLAGLRLSVRTGLGAADRRARRDRRPAFERVRNLLADAFPAPWSAAAAVPRADEAPPAAPGEAQDAAQEEDPWRSLRADWEALFATLDAGRADDVAYEEAMQEAMDAQLQTLLHDRWADVKAAFDRLAAQRAAGTLDPEAFRKALSELAPQLERSREMQAKRRDLRQHLIGRLGCDPERHPEIRPALTALTAWHLLKDDPAAPKAVLAMMGTAVEGALRTHLVDPYFDAFRRGEAACIDLDAYSDRFRRAVADARPLMLGHLSVLWGRLVKYWRSEPKSAALAEWVEATFAAPDRLHNERLKVLSEITTLRNKGPHFRPGDDEPTADDVARMLALTLDDAPGVLPALYRARFG
jgi:hypothetical protein